MKILLVNTYSHGGASLACRRLHMGLLGKGIDSRLLLLERKGEPDVQSALFEGKPAPRVNRKYFTARFPFITNERKVRSEIKALVPGTIEWFSYADPGFDITTHPFYQEADIINLHWVSDFLDYSFFQKNKKPVVWTLHDMNPFTGGCHYNGECHLFENDCAVCPQLATTSYPRYSHEIWKYKQTSLHGVNNLSIVTLSEWMEKEAGRSSLFRNFPKHRIPNGLDADTFQPCNKIEARNALGLPMDKKIVLFVAYKAAYNKRKGFHLLKQALKSLQRDDTILCSVGSQHTGKENLPGLVEVGVVEDEKRMAMLYSAADVFVIPSLQDNLPNTAVESILCGTPVVGFRVGGIADIIVHGKNGILVDAVDAPALMKGLHHALDHLQEFSREGIREDAVRRYAREVQASEYIQLYKSILQPATSTVQRQF